MQEFLLVLFSIEKTVIQRMDKAGVKGFIVDWENKGKEERQINADTEINYNTFEDLQRVRNATESLVLCRINAPYENTKKEVDKAILAGADEVLLPMIRYPEEVERVLKMVDDRCGTGILIETVEALERLSDLSSLPLSRVYVGLNDLSIERKSDNIFVPLIDGTLDQIRNHFPHIPFGFGGLTLPDHGFPIPCKLLIGEMSRLSCDFSFLRRSFYRDTVHADPDEAISTIQQALDSAKNRSSDKINSDKAALANAIIKFNRIQDKRSV
jgi:hypothetical protein